ncbi:MAG: hypothetical protein IKN12_05170 [Selenomonadaceae bacterium]|nr:hypothetical protein [Selenomonadaceae bacterium]
MLNTELNQQQQQEAIDKIIEKLDKLNDWGLGRVTGYMESLLTMPTAVK